MTSWHSLASTIPMRKSCSYRGLTSRWRDFGIIWAYVVVNIVGAIGLYWIFRVPKKPRKDKTVPEDTAEKRSHTQSEK